MRLSDIRPASYYAQNYGVKLELFGEPSAGKTRLCTTAPSPLLFAAENGLLSCKDKDTPTYKIDTFKQFKESVDWVTGSKESGQFQTIIYDSGSQIAEWALEEAKKLSKDGRKHYGQMKDAMMQEMARLYLLRGKHIIVTAKMGFSEEEGYRRKVPLYPGQALAQEVHHLFDEVWFLGKVLHEGQQVPVLRTQATNDIFCRSRSLPSNIELWQPDLNQVFNYCLNGVDQYV